MDDIEQAASMRVTVNLSPKSTQALADVAQWQEETRTNVINSAIRLYWELVNAERSGRGVYVRRPDSFTGEQGELERVRFI